MHLPSNQMDNYNLQSWEYIFHHFDKCNLTYIHSHVYQQDKDHRT